MRILLNGLYRASGLLAGFFLVLICAIVILQVVGNLIDRILILTTGNPIGIIIPSYSDFAGFFLAASTFLALTYTFREGGHIRVRLLVQRSSPRVRWILEVWCLGFASLFMVYFTYYTILLMMESLEYGDLSPGIVPVPLWIPQAVMVLGLAVFTIALLDDFFRTVASRSTSFVNDEEKTAEETL